MFIILRKERDINLLAILVNNSAVQQVLHYLLSADKNLVDHAFMVASSD
jgi:hypothetical protein